jgi:hypothetical protein
MFRNFMPNTHFSAIFTEKGKSKKKKIGEPVLENGVHNIFKMTVQT